MLVEIAGGIGGRLRWSKVAAMTAENTERELIYIMADFGMGPYAWRHGNIADSITGFPPEFGVTKELEADFAEWAISFEKDYDSPAFDWEAFHRRGIELSKRLKQEIGTRFDIEYHKAIEDPAYENDYEKWKREKVIPIED